MEKEKAWVWFKGGVSGGFWQGGFKATKSTDEGVLIEHADFKNCRVPEWRICLSEPTNKKAGPKIPEGAIWIYT